MKIYRSIWVTIVGTCVLLCTGVGLIVWPPLGVLVLFVLVALAAGAAIVGNRLQAGTVTRGRRALVRGAAAPASAIGICTVAVLVLADTAGALVLPVLVLAAATSPWAVGLIARAQGAILTTAPPQRERAVDGGGAPPDVAGPPSTHDLSERQLCQIWRETFAALQQSTTIASRARIVAIRQACLDGSTSATRVR